MLSYQHIYHAGNFADVHKHAALILLAKALLVKPQPLTFLDTHAGRGLYDLGSAEARKTQEFIHGISHFWSHRHKLAQTPLAGYIDAIARFNPDGELNAYPGSPLILCDLLRRSDRLICIERHPGEFRELQKNTAQDKRIEALQQDGFQALVDMCPLPGLRGLVVVDPSYEIKTEYKDLASQVFKAWKKWPQGIFMLWYPILPDAPHTRLLTGLHETGIKDILVSEIRLDAAPQEDFRMRGSGIALINPPFPAAPLGDLTQALASHMPQKSEGKVFWLHTLAPDADSGLLF